MAQRRSRWTYPRRRKQSSGDRLLLPLVIGLIVYSSAVSMVRDTMAAIASMSLPGKILWLSFITSAIVLAGYGLIHYFMHVGELKRRKLLARAELSKMQKMNPYQFEQYAAEMFRCEGWDSVEVTPKSNDGGKDLILRKRNTKALVECKRQKQPIGRPVVQKLHSAIITSGADTGYIVSTSGASKPAAEYAHKVGIALVTGQNLAERARAAFSSR